MVNYTENELFSITDFTKKISSLLKDVKNNSIEKIGILKNNRLEAVVLSTTEYTRLKQIEENVMKDNWLKENREAIDKQNERLQKYGCFSDEHRRF